MDKKYKKIKSFFVHNFNECHKSFSLFYRSVMILSDGLNKNRNSLKKSEFKVNFL